jgi:hypothetical protein
MKKTLLLCGVLLALSATVASAAGLNLRWSDCGAAGSANRNAACTAVTGNNIMIASAIAPQVLNEFVGIDVVMDLQTAGAQLPPWWLLDATTGCRPAALTMNSDFSGTPSEGAACADIFIGGGGGGISAYFAGFGGQNRARIIAFWAVAAPRVLGTAETYMFRMNVNNTNTDVCGGCLEPACITLNQITLTQPLGVGDYPVTNAALAQHVTWQNGTGLDCPGATPAKSATWGQVKSLYR